MTFVRACYIKDSTLLYFHNTDSGSRADIKQKDTFRNFINNCARNLVSSQSIHSASKYRVLGAFASIAGAVEAVARLVCSAVKCIFKAPFSCCIPTGVGRDLSNFKSAFGLASYHTVNMCTLGFIGYAISDEGENPKVAIARGCPYGDQDLAPVAQV